MLSFRIGLKAGSVNRWFVIRRSYPGVLRHMDDWFLREVG